jgi:hypothetical protein
MKERLEGKIGRKDWKERLELEGEEREQRKKEAAGNGRIERMQ